MKTIKDKISKAAKILGSIKSEKKALSSRNNGKLGGRPTKKILGNSVDKS